MEYRGEHIEDRIYTTKHISYKELGDNDFDLTLEDLEQFASDLRKKEQELKDAGVEFKNLRFNFYATERLESDYHDYPAECEVSFDYDIKESDEDAEMRIAKAKARIDQKINEEEKREAAKKERETKKVQDAIALLKENGFTVVDFKESKKL